jgi:integrase
MGGTEVASFLSHLATTRTVAASTHNQALNALVLRVKDLEFERGRIVVRQGKGDKDRLTPFPEALKAELKKHLERVKLSSSGEQLRHPNRSGPTGA